MGEPNLLRQPMKWRAAGVAKGVDLSTAGGKRQFSRIPIPCHIPSPFHSNLLVICGLGLIPARSWDQKEGTEPRS